MSFFGRCRCRSWQCVQQETNQFSYMGNTMIKRQWFNLFIGLFVGFVMGATALFGSNFAMAQDEADSERTKFMKRIGGNAGALGAVLRGEAVFGPELAKNAQAIADLAAELPAQFPEGTAVDRAKPEIWATWAEFEAKANALAAESAKLVDVIEAGDEAGYPAQFMATVGNCRSCHDSYRVPEEE